MKIYRGRSSLHGKRVAAIDIGSHTTRMLVAEYTGSLHVFKALYRKREYTSLAEGFRENEKGHLTRDAVERTAKALNGFVSRAKGLGVDTFIALSTGVARRAENKQYFIDSVKEKTGIDIDIISGEREAFLTRKGVILGSGKSGSGSDIIFDLGGATTEFIWGPEDDMRIRSLPMGALVLTQDYLDSDPPGDDKILNLSRAVDAVLSQGALRDEEAPDDIKLIGSGGTITTIAAIINKLRVREIIPENINGSVIKSEQIKALLGRIRHMPVSERIKIRGMEKGRAGVILAGTLAVLRIMCFFRSMEMTVSYSDILEGIIISYIMEGDNE